MGEPREVQIGDRAYFFDERGPYFRRERPPFKMYANGTYGEAVREIARLQEENRRLREEGILLRGEISEHADPEVTRAVHGPGCECYTCAP